MTDEQLAELRAKAKAATPGPWSWDGRDLETVLGHGSSCIILSAEDGWSPRPADEMYLAAVDPATVLALLDEIDRLRKGGR